jgi:UDP-3-O-[3-hydroxymyristoyl] glucosamine N-acyltransferase
MLLSELVQQFGGELVGDGSLEITGATGATHAGPKDITYAMGPNELAQAEASPAGCVIVQPDAALSSKTVIRSESPNAYFADLMEFFHPALTPEPGIHPSAVIHADASVSASATIGPQACVGAASRIADHAVIGPGSVIGARCSVGTGTVIHANVTLYDKTQIGNRVIIHSGTVIGADGFGFFPHKGALRKWPHVGNVSIEDEVEIGANTCIDRAKFGTTRIGRGSKIDNHVQIAHNCELGQGCIVAALTGLAGSVFLEDGVICGGQVGILEQVKVGKGAMLAAKSGILRDIPPGSINGGIPSRPNRDTMQLWALEELLIKNQRTIRKLIREADQGK